MAAPLHNHVLFESSDIDETREYVARVFCPHALTPGANARRVSAQMHHMKFGSKTSLSYLKYGPKVTVEPGPLEDFFNIQVQMQGCVRTRCGTQIENILPGSAGVLSASQYSSMHWSPDSAMLILSIDRHYVEGKLETLIGRPVHNPVVFNTKMSLHEPSCGSWLRTLSFFQTEVDAGRGFVNRGPAAAAFEEGLVVSLLYAQEHNYSHLLLDNTSCVAPAHVKRVEVYIQEHAGEAVSIEDLARVSQTSVRSLFAGFKRFKGTSPMRYLRAVRLDRVREDLLRCGAERSVTDIATSWGFVQLGRFSKEYKDRFGELPSETLRNTKKIK